MPFIKKDSSATSAVLFLNIKGEPMRFFICPGPTKVKLQPLIANGGGVLCRTQEPNAILLADPSDIPSALQGVSHFYISTQYVHDCVAQNQQLDIKNYRLSNLQPVQTRATSRNQQGTGRMGYSLEDDSAILNFIAKHKSEAKGNRIWQQMERKCITGHSWQSMKDRFLKHLQHKVEQRSPEKKKKVSPLKESSSSEDNISQPEKKKTPRKKALVISSSESDSTQISHVHEGGIKELPELQPSPEESSNPEDPALRKRQMNEVMRETDGDESVPEKEQQLVSEEPEVLPKRARMHTGSPEQGTPCGPNDQSPTLIEKQNSRKSAACSRRKLGILQRAAIEFQDSQLIHESQEDQLLSQGSPLNTSDTAEAQIMAARKRVVREQAVNSDALPAVQNHRSSPGSEDNDAGPSSATLPITSNAHMFLFQQESQEELSQPPEEDPFSQILLETKQHVVRLMQESKKDLVEVMKALLKASGDVTLALSYLLERYDPEVHGPIWTRQDDEMLLSADSLDCERLRNKYGAERVSKRAAFLEANL